MEWLFADGGRAFPDRIRVAAAAGFDHVEFWTAGDKDVDGVEKAIRESGVTVTCFVSEPVGRLVDPATHEDFLGGVEQSAALAARLNARNLIVVSGDARPDLDRDRQLEAIRVALGRAALIAAGAGIRLLLEPLNTIDHPGYFLDSTSDALQVLRDVDHPSVRLLLDMYHSTVMGEDPAQVVKGSGDLIGHVHIADVPGRHEPGSGQVDWPAQLAGLRAVGYTGALGLEYIPTEDTASSLRHIQRLAR